MRASRLILIASAALLAMAGSAFAAPGLTGQATITRDTIQLGDLFTGLPAGVRADTPVMKAPSAGQRTLIDAQVLAQLSTSYRIGWVASGPNDRVTVERAGQTASRESVISVLQPVLAARGMPPNSDITLDPDVARLQVPADGRGQLGVEALTYDANGGRFTATMAINVDGRLSDRQRITGRVIAMVDVPVPNRLIQAGEVIQSRDIDLTRVRLDQAKNSLGDPDKVIGRTAKRILMAQQPIRPSDVNATLLVTKNSIVTVKVLSGRMALSMQGKALDDGAQGEAVRILNPRSNQTIQGVVTGVSAVSINTNYGSVAN